MAKRAVHAKGRQGPPGVSMTVVLSLSVLVLGVAGAAFLALRTPTPHVPVTTAAASPIDDPFALRSVTPPAGSADVASNAVLTVAFTAPVTASGPMPTLTPAIPGQWTSDSPNGLIFMPSAPLVPGTAETLTVPAGPSGMVGTSGQHLATAATVHFTVAAGSTLRLQQLLAQLDYLPVSFAPQTTAAPHDEATPQPGTFSWRWPDQPASLTSLWTPGTYGVLTRGAVMSFQTQHGLKVDATTTGPGLWTALLAAVQSASTDAAPYGYVYVSTTLPESATIYQNGAVAYTTLVNTGIPSTPTAPGTYPVYLRYQVTTMSGTNPTGSHYSDPGIPWVSYFNGGDALHGFIRASYGYPQSLGCVEMPYANAAVVWPMTPIGTLVTVE